MKRGETARAGANNPTTPTTQYAKPTTPPIKRSSSTSPITTPSSMRRQPTKISRRNSHQLKAPEEYSLADKALCNSRTRKSTSTRPTSTLKTTPRLTLKSSESLSRNGFSQTRKSVNSRPSSSRISPRWGRSSQTATPNPTAGTTRRPAITRNTSPL